MNAHRYFLTTHERLHMTRMGGLMVLGVLVAGCSGLAAEAPARLRFHRPARVGQEVSCRFEAATETRVIRVLTDGRSQATSEDSGLELAGLLRITAVTDAGQAAAATLAVETACLRLGGRSMTPAWQGQTLEIDFTSSPRCEFRNRETGEGLPEAEARLLGMVFHPATGETLADQLGGERSAVPGASWPLDTGGLRRQLAARGMKADPAQVVGTAIFAGERRFRGMACHAVSTTVAASGIPGYGLALDVELLLPEDDRLGVARVERSAREEIHQALPGEEPLAANVREIRIETRERMSGEFVPVPG
jgi:hypothetical protein